jgi:ribosome recycling factor
MSQELIKSTKDSMQKTLDAYAKEISTIKTGRANASILDLIKVEYYGFPTPLIEIATISTPEPRVI